MYEVIQHAHYSLALTKPDQQRQGNDEPGTPRGSLSELATCYVSRRRVDEASAVQCSVARCGELGMPVAAWCSAHASCMQQGGPRAD